MTQQPYNIFSLPSGLRCVHWLTNSKVAYCGIVINAGSGNDPQQHFGLAHFVEHTIFKGTEKLRSWHISNRMEAIGGDLNAYTSKEETVIYTTAPAGYLDRTLSLLSEIVGRSKFPQAEVEKEKEVIIEEINSYLDSPSDNVYDRFEDLYFKGSGLGHNILGTRESVKGFGSEDCRGFIDTFYVPGNMVIYVASPDSFSLVEKKVRNRFAFFNHVMPPTRNETIAEQPNFNITDEVGAHQSHTLMGFRAFTRSDSRRFTLLLLNNYFGGPGMNSLLNREMREKRGYVYTVDSSVSLYSQTGMMMVYFGSDAANAEKCRKLVVRELEKLANSPMKPKVFTSARRQYLGQLCISSDHYENRAMALAKSILYYNELHDTDYIASRINEITPEGLRCVAETLMKSGFSSLTLQ